MAWRYSTGLVQKMAERSSIKEALRDGVVKIYTGAQPASANAAPTGTLLVTITNASGSFTEGTPSTPQVDKINVSAATQASQTYTLTINPTSSEYSTETHTFITDASQTVDELGQGMADTINYGGVTTEASVLCHAIYDATGNDIFISGPAGQAYVITLTANPDSDLVLSADQTNDVRINGLQFGLATGGVLVKEADIVWSGVVATAGTAGWFRVQANAVDNDSLSTTLVRADGSCGLSNSDMNLTNLNLVAGVTVTVSTFTITIPKVAT